MGKLEGRFRARPLLREPADSLARRRACASNLRGISRTGGAANLKHSIVAGNTDGSATTKYPDCATSVTSQGHNLIGNNTGCVFTPATGDQVGTGASPIDPRLDLLADNGGPTRTHALLAGSPAIEAGDPAGCADSQGNPLTTDQRGQLRPADGDGNGSAVCDKGAFEVVPPATPTPTASPGPTLTASPTASATPGWQYVTYTYTATGHAHAVSDLSTGEHYVYDANGNMTSRTEGGATYAQAFDAENRLVAVTVNGQTTQFVYDGDGALVKKIRPDGTATVYIGAIYEVELSAGGAQTGTTSYYALPGTRVQRSGASVSYVLTDHLGSASVTLDSTGIVAGEQRYYPFGATRAANGTISTDRLFTGQRAVAELGIYHFNARFYSGTLGRFLSADTIVPEWTNPQSLNRYSYVYNTPTRLIDPSGYSPCDDSYWPTAFKEAHGRAPTAGDYQDCSFASRVPGSGAHGAWTDVDWQALYLARQVLAAQTRGPIPVQEDLGFCLPAGLGCSGGSHYANWWRTWYLPRLPGYTREDLGKISSLPGLIGSGLDIAEHFDGLPFQTIRRVPVSIGLGLDFFAQLMEDAPRAGLSWPQRIGRATVRGIEGAAISTISNAGGNTAGLASASRVVETANPIAVLSAYAAGYALGYTATNVALSNYAGQLNEQAVFPSFGQSLDKR